MAKMEEMLGLRKRRGFAPKKLPILIKASDELPKLDRFSFIHVTDGGVKLAFLANNASATTSLALIPEKYLSLAQGGGDLACMMRKFEGRTWKGVHHHLVLAAMAKYVSSTE
jgi:hypothetical protein